MTVVNPVSVNVIEYVPGRRFSIRYCPVPSVTAERVFSISAGLAASTVTPGRTAPDVSSNDSRNRRLREDSGRNEHEGRE